MTQSEIIIILLIINFVAVVFVIMRARGASTGDSSGNIVREEMRLNRDESSREAKSLREELGRGQKASLDSLLGRLSEFGNHQQQRLDALTKTNRDFETASRQEIEKIRHELVTHFKESAGIQQNFFNEVQQKLENLMKANREEGVNFRDRMEQQFKEIQKSNETKLDEMRQTVDEKLHGTLEKRLGESFKLVSERLEAVQQGLGEMRNLATGVGDLKKVLTNVKTRGTWGEIQLGAILEQVLTPDQYSTNVVINKDSSKSKTVEFAIKLPGLDEKIPVWLPIDSKFPKESYERLIDISQTGDPKLMKKAQDDLTTEIIRCANDINSKYILPPETTDFAIMFLPTEGLYAEVLRQAGLHDRLQHEYRVLPAGPTTLSAILNSLQMGFRTLAIEKRSSEVWHVLAAVKTEFSRFGKVLEKVKKQLNTASNTIDETKVRTRSMERTLRNLEVLPGEQAGILLRIENNISSDDFENDEGDVSEEADV